MSANGHPRRLYRSRNDRVLAGLAGGLAEYLGWDSVWLRLLLAFLVLAGIGSPIVLYMIAWLIVPRNPELSDLGRNRLHRSASQRMIAGICGGIAESTGSDPTIVRLIAAVLLLSGGIALPFYLLAWLVMPLQR